MESCAVSCWLLFTLKPAFSLSVCETSLPTDKRGNTPLSSYQLCKSRCHMHSIHTWFGTITIPAHHYRWCWKTCSHMSCPVAVVTSVWIRRRSSATWVLTFRKSTYRRLETRESVLASCLSSYSHSSFCGLSFQVLTISSVPRPYWCLGYSTMWTACMCL